MAQIIGTPVIHGGAGKPTSSLGSSDKIIGSPVIHSGIKPLASSSTPSVDLSKIDTANAGYTQSTNAPKDIFSKAYTYAKGLVLAPKATIHDIVTKQPIRTITGGGPVVERANAINQTGDKNVVIDHIMPLSLGGTNDKANLQIQDPTTSAEKDVLEKQLFTQLSTGKISMKEAQKQMQSYIDSHGGSKQLAATPENKPSIFQRLAGGLPGLKSVKQANPTGMAKVGTKLDNLAGGLETAAASSFIDVAHAPSSEQAKPLNELNKNQLSQEEASFKSNPTNNTSKSFKVGSVIGQVAPYFNPVTGAIVGSQELLRSRTPSQVIGNATNLLLASGLAGKAIEPLLKNANLVNNLAKAHEAGLTAEDITRIGIDNLKQPLPDTGTAFQQALKNLISPTKIAKSAAAGATFATAGALGQGETNLKNLFKAATTGALVGVGTHGLTGGIGATFGRLSDLQRPVTPEDVKTELSKIAPSDQKLLSAPLQQKLLGEPSKQGVLIKQTSPAEFDSNFRKLSTSFDKETRAASNLPEPRRTTVLRDIETRHQQALNDLLDGKQILLAHPGKPEAGVATPENVVGSFPTKRFGSVDLRQGEIPKGKSTGYGQAKIDYKQLGLSQDDIAHLIETLPVKEESNNRIVLEDSNYRVLLSKDWLGEPTDNLWLSNVVKVRGAGIEPATSTVSELHSTTELPAPVNNTKSTEKVNTVVPKAEMTKVPGEQLPVGGGKERLSRLEARIKGQLDAATPEERQGLSTYQQMNKADQISKAVDYVTKNPDEALAVLKGEKNAPEGLLHNSIALTLEEYAKDSNDSELVRKLASLRSTRAGQEISILTQRDANSPVTKIAELQQHRIEALGGKDKVNMKVKVGVMEGQKAVRSTLTAPKDWSDFMRSIQC